VRICGPLVIVLICGPLRVVADRPSDLPAPVVWGTKCDRAPDGTDDNARVRMSDSGNFQSDTTLGQVSLVFQRLQLHVDAHVRIA
jgi:hypothetical protein